MLEPIEDQYLMIGHIARSHGVKGEVLIISEVFAPQLFDEIDLVHIQNARGDLVPARIESVRVQEKNNRLSFFVKFEHVSDRNRAEELKSSAVYVLREKAESLVDGDEAIDYTEFEIQDDQNNNIGIITGIIESPAHPILEVITDDQEKLLIPFVDEYIQSVDEDQSIIYCQNLEQLTNL
ncbi:16S rRNA processing protein RimM [Balneolaceae bacterium YR4-1]|uniref:Ribosome maturation factor RimM n=1 Tax=Halalkalibaculum roseum TaxID=2709311 RepID=A0A6M1T4L9_9BACT|nr:ribosome maturation factor RimM [Halalkalibaculum roseum]NGP77727.1 16S rRNA processing protein RimM [Halalkalibaculum roseum]